jgi:hypothetical protein
MPPGTDEIGAVLRLEETDECHLPHGRKTPSEHGPRAGLQRFSSHWQFR